MTDQLRALHEVQLTPEEVERILRECGTHALLVGGQALAAWAVYFGIAPAGELSRVVTTDADFIGTSDVARALQKSLGDPWKLVVGTLDDVGGQVAKVYASLPAQGIKQVDFLSGIVGLDTAAVRNRASHLITSDGVEVQVLHPLDVLDAIPVERIALPRFHEQQWPRIQARPARKREKFAACRCGVPICTQGEGRLTADQIVTY